MQRCEKYSIRGIRCRRNALANITMCALHVENTPSANARNDFLSDDHERIRNACRYYNNDAQNEDIVDEFCDANLMDRVVFLLRNTAFNDVRYDVMNMLCNLTSVRNNRSVDLLIQSAGSEFQTIMMKDSDTSLIRGCAYLVLSNIAGSGASQANVVIGAGFGTRAAQQILDIHSSFMIRNEASCLISNISRYCNAETGREILTILAAMPTVHLAEIKIMKFLLWTINKIYEKTNTLCGFPHQTILEYLLLPQTFANSLRLIGNIISGNNSELIRSLVSCGLLRTLETIVINNQLTQKTNEFLWMLSNLVVDIPDAFIESPKLLNYVIHCADNNFEATFIIANMLSLGTPRIHDQLVCNGGIYKIILGLKKRKVDCVKIVLEALIKYLEKHTSYNQYMLNRIGDEVRCLCSHADPVIATNASLICELLIKVERENLLPRAAAEISLPAYNPSQSVVLAIDSLRNSILGGISPSVDISDLNFSPQDMAFLRALGYRLLPDGQLCINPTIWLI
jgi:hypothetical protein